MSIDGGGIRGIIPATILASIEERTGKPIAEMFDLIAGTSTGGLLTLGLTKPNSLGKPEFTARQLCRLYEEQIPHVFRNPQSWWGNLLSPKYRADAFRQVLKNSLGDCRLKDALTAVLIPCYDIENREPYIFKSQLASLRSQCDFPMRDVALAASATPTLFHPVPVGKSSQGRSICLVDGGVFANNPAVSALSEIKSMPPGEGETFFMVSIGTGKSSRPLMAERVSRWGYVQWSRPMLELVMESLSESVHDQMRHLLPSNHDASYYRLQVNLPSQMSVAIDNADSAHMQALMHIAEEFCSQGQSAESLKKVCETLLRLSEQKLDEQSLAR